MQKNHYFAGARELSIKKIGTLGIGQDGAIYKDYLFHFESNGECKVYSFPAMELISSFALDSQECMLPHSNSVCFGSEFYEENDEFPLLYSNVYNNYQKEEDRREGTCCVYRLTRQGDVFSTNLVQIIKVDFVDNTALWKSENVADIRPYGNFVTDNKNKMLYVFVMRDEARQTRFFKFRLLGKDEGVLCEKCGVKVVRLREEDILDQFDSEYINFMQGATYYEGYIYSVEGFDVKSGLLPIIKIFDMEEKKMVFNAELVPLGLEYEMEFIEVYKDKMYFADRAGELYEAVFRDSLSM